VPGYESHSHFEKIFAQVVLVFQGLLETVCRRLISGPPKGRRIERKPSQVRLGIQGLFETRAHHLGLDGKALWRPALSTRPESDQKLVDQPGPEILDARWYAARTKPRQEAVAVLNLARQDFEAYSPQVTVERYKQTASSGQRITIEREPLFPGYVLVKFALENFGWRSINSTRGVIELLRFGDDGGPCSLPRGEVESIQRREISGQLFISEVRRVRQNDSVKVKFGPAADKIGRVIFTKGERVELLLNLLGRETRVQAPLHAVEVVEPHKIYGHRRPVR